MCVFQAYKFSEIQEIIKWFYNLVVQNAEQPTKNLTFQQDIHAFVVKLLILSSIPGSYLIPVEKHVGKDLNQIADISV